VLRGQFSCRRGLNSADLLVKAISQKGTTVRLLVNDEPCSMRFDPDTTLRSIAHAVCPPDSASPHLVVSVVCDGRTITDDNLEAALEAPAGAYDEIALQTQPLRSLLAASLSQALEMSGSLDARRLAAADLFAQGENQQALQVLQQLLGDWRVVHQAAATCATALNLPLESVQTGGSELPAVLERIKTQLADLKGALACGDLVLVADILRFELEEPLAAWSAGLRSLHAMV
jgi:hypothetical protein